MKPAADLLVLAEEHAFASAKAHVEGTQAEGRGCFGDARDYRAEAQSLATTSLAFSQLAEARAIYMATEPTLMVPIGDGGR